MPRKIELTCPQCTGRLSHTSDSLECAACGARYPVMEGISDLRVGRKDYYFNPVARAQMREIIADMTGDGWARAIRRFMAEVRFNPDWMDNLVSDGRYAWKLFLGLEPDARVLDLGCGLGNLTKNLAPHVGEVCALDLTWERLQFAQRRFAIFNSEDRISLVAGGDGSHLPFADGTFDAVMISGVLEWVADDSTLWSGAPDRLGKIWRMIRAHFGSNNPRRVQRRFLQEIRRVLKPGGLAFIGIENRLSREYFGRRPDHHSGLWFGSLLPRPVATLYSIARAHVPYRTYTYAYPGYRRLLAESGFAQSSFLGLSPGYSHLKEIIPFDDDTGRWMKPARRTSAWTSKLSVPAYGILAFASAGRSRAPNLIERIARDAEIGSGSKMLSLRLSGLQVVDDAVAVCSGELDGRSVSLRVALNENAAAAEDANHAAISRISSAAGSLRALVAAPIAQGRVQRVAYYLQASVPGRSMRQCCGDVLGRFLESGERLFVEMNPDLRQAEPVIFGPEIFRREVDDRLLRIAAATGDGRTADDVRGVLWKLLAGGDLRIGLTHGNPVPENIRVEGSRISGIVNWEHWAAAGVPIVDCLRFVHGVLLATRPDLSPVEAIALLADLSALPTELRAFVETQYQALGFEPARHRGFAYLCWLQHAANNIAGTMLDPKKLDASVKCVMASIALQPKLAAAPVSRAA